MKIIQALRFGLMLLLGASSSAESFHRECFHFFAETNTASKINGRQYAPDRKVDVLHLALDVTPDFKQRKIGGTAVIKFTPIAEEARELALDAVDLRVESVEGTKKVESFHVSNEKLVILFSDAIKPGEEASVTVKYEAYPDKGLYFRTAEMGYKPGDTQVWTQGETHEARHWYPCFDFPSDKFTSQVTCTVPKEMVVFSNGKKIRDEVQGDSRRVTWQQSKPHVNYLISLVAGYFKTITDKHRDIELAFHVSPEDIEYAENSFAGTKDMMEFFEKEIGVNYPWDKYHQICVQDFHWGGMENTSISTLNERTLFSKEFENLRSSQGLVAHELAHQWFGDLVTCKDWSHIWLNEGFATYYDQLYEGHKNGRDSFLFEMYKIGKSITARSNDYRAIVTKSFSSPEAQFRDFGYLSYGKGSWILHMLRADLGEDLYRKCVKTFVERYAYKTADTENFKSVIEELSGRSFDLFFDQWLYHGHHPEIEASYRWNPSQKLATISLKQVQKLSPTVLLFEFPLTVRFVSGGETIVKELKVRKVEEDFVFALEAAPEMVRLDPNLNLLAKININLPQAFVEKQLERDDGIGRLLALEQIGKRKDAKALELIAKAAQNDKFWAVRAEAARILRSMQTPDALAKLLKLEDKDARVRQQIYRGIGGYYHEESFKFIRAALQKEKNPEIKSELIRLTSLNPTQDLKEGLLAALKSDSFRQEIADGAISAMRALDEVSYIEPIQTALKEREHDFSSSTFGRGLETIGWLARNEDKVKPEIQGYLSKYINSHKRQVQNGAINGLRNLGDPAAISMLETLSDGAADAPGKRQADEAIAALRAQRKPSENLSEIRRELLELKRQNKDLEKELESLRKQVEAKPNEAAENSRKSRAAAPRRR